MKTAADFAKVAANLRQIATAMQPPEADPHKNARSEIQWYVNRAAAKAQEIAEHLARNEPRPAA